MLELTETVSSFRPQRPCFKEGRRLRRFEGVGSATDDQIVVAAVHPFRIAPDLPSRNAILRENQQHKIPNVGPNRRAGVIVESSRKSTLSGIEEFGAVSSVTEQASDGGAVVRGGLRGPEAVLERFCWPNVVAIEGDVFPAERRDMSNKIVGNDFPATARPR
jgi:hypothetical protein